MAAVVTPVRAVLFDAVGTLLRPEPSVAVAYHEIAGRHGVKMDLETISGRFPAAFARQEKIDLTTLDYGTSEAREHARWQAIVADVFEDVPAVPAIFADLWDHFAQPSSWRLFDDVEPCLTRMQKMPDVTLGIASNFDQRLYAVLAGFPPLAPLSRVYVSSLVGARKPGRAFFEAVATDLGISPAEILLVGDDLINDHRGALAAGWQSIFLDRSGHGGIPGSLRSLSELGI